MSIESVEENGPNSDLGYKPGDNYSFPHSLIESAKVAKQSHENQLSAPARLAQTLQTGLIQFGVFSPEVHVKEDHILLTAGSLCVPTYLDFMAECGINPLELRKLLPPITLETTSRQRLTPTNKLQIARFIGATRGVVAASAESLVGDEGRRQIDPWMRASLNGAITGIDLIALGLVHKRSPIRLPQVAQNAHAYIATSGNPTLQTLVNRRPEYFVSPHTPTNPVHLTQPRVTPKV